MRRTHARRVWTSTGSRRSRGRELARHEDGSPDWHRPRCEPDNSLQAMAGRAGLWWGCTTLVSAGVAALGYGISRPAVLWHLYEFRAMLPGSLPVQRLLFGLIAIFAYAAFVGVVILAPKLIQRIPPWRRRALALPIPDGRSRTYSDTFTWPTSERRRDGRAA